MTTEDRKNILTFMFHEDEANYMIGKQLFNNSKLSLKELLKGWGLTYFRVTTKTIRGVRRRKLTFKLPNQKFQIIKLHDNKEWWYSNTGYKKLFQKRNLPRFEVVCDVTYVNGQKEFFASPQHEVFKSVRDVISYINFRRNSFEIKNSKIK